MGSSALVEWDLLSQLSHVNTYCSAVSHLPIYFALEFPAQRRGAGIAEQCQWCKANAAERL